MATVTGQTVFQKYVFLLCEEVSAGKPFFNIYDRRSPKDGVFIRSPIHV
jgi:hypothetical protein